MPKDNLKVIFDRFLNGTASKEELETIMDSFQEKENSSLSDRIRYELEKEETIDHSAQRLEISNRVFNSLAKINVDNGPKKQIKTTQFIKLLPKKWSSIAASILFAGILGLIWMFSDTLRTGSQDISLPTTNEATILFDDGQLISVLKSDKDLLMNRGIEIVHLPNNEIAFKIHANPKIPSQHQTFSSPKGTVSQLILSDGTHIWLNSATEVTYPSTFPTAERRIAMNGEAYLDVHRDVSKPFVVDADGTQVKVLGTAFNIATNIKSGHVLTTLLHGSVEVGTAQQKLIISPGMQSKSNNKSGSIHTYDVTSTDEVAWKSGFFKFNHDDVYTILDKIKTWYDIEDYEVQSTTNDRFSGTIKRTKKLSELLQNLEKISGYKFKIIDRRVIAMK